MELGRVDFCRMMEKCWNEFITSHFYSEYFWERNTPGKIKQRHIGRKMSKTEVLHVPADESEQINSLLENLLKQFHRSENLNKMPVLQESSCWGWAVEFVGAMKENLSIRESACVGVCMIVVNYITYGLKHSCCKVERFTW